MQQRLNEKLQVCPKNLSHYRGSCQVLRPFCAQVLPQRRIQTGRIELLTNVNVRGVGSTAEQFGEGTEKRARAAGSRGLAPLLTVENHGVNNGEKVGGSKPESKHAQCGR